MTSILKKSVCKKIRVMPLTSVTYRCGIYKLSVSYGLNKLYNWKDEKVATSYYEKKSNNRNKKLAKNT